MKLDQAAAQARGGQQAERAIFCGDVIHHALQIHALHWAHIVDQDPALARITQRKLLEHCVESGALLLPAHFGAPHVARIVEAGSGFAPRFVAAG